MKFQGAIIKEQGITFVIIVVAKHAVDNPDEGDQAIESYGTLFPGVPIILMAQDDSGRPSYYGRQDIADFMTHVPLKNIPWKEYTLKPGGGA